MRFALITLLVYLTIYIVGDALADLNDLELPKSKPGLASGMYLDFSNPHPDKFIPHQFLDKADKANAIRCNGYPTNNPSENFCSETIPNDWTANEFNGDIYYLIRLNDEPQVLSKQ